MNWQKLIETAVKWLFGALAVAVYTLSIPLRNQVNRSIGAIYQIVVIIVSEAWQSSRRQVAIGISVAVGLALVSVVLTGLAILFGGTAGMVLVVLAVMVGGISSWAIGWVFNSVAPSREGAIRTVLMSINRAASFVAVLVFSAGFVLAILYYLGVDYGALIAMIVMLGGMAYSGSCNYLGREQTWAPRLVLVVVPLGLTVLATLAVFNVRSVTVEMSQSGRTYTFPQGTVYYPATAEVTTEIQEPTSEQVAALQSTLRFGQETKVILFDNDEPQFLGAIAVYRGQKEDGAVVYVRKANALPDEAMGSQLTGWVRHHRKVTALVLPAVLLLVVAIAGPRVGDSARGWATTGLVIVVILAGFLLYNGQSSSMGANVSATNVVIVSSEWTPIGVNAPVQNPQAKKFMVMYQGDVPPVVHYRVANPAKNFEGPSHRFTFSSGSPGWWWATWGAVNTGAGDRFEFKLDGGSLVKLTVSRV
ncbi:MAG: hypothetical protein COT81_05715 [Candidatus Buchananbacteria bacterium CG10_big_fil_rev_8_21_14_0_10_42_9]|uniref:Uncharacterized protein n=1 Tax=Candidatus Buchananbacteria bacterium CG10_big_fil_rev_8_21_14_0_10_42_9 TaxID=1974526 RepID=A0A2H0VZQ6_9BACT|nr:MAG: hypothetical protein COT81_05715 [Candidatus Buchananbacteria bacterium CG10_big_fil_rev_8_21_14_0_10_42_9]